jgi:uncharacterized iron-regulated membrane protein
MMSWVPRFSTVVKKSLAGHAWLGLVGGGLMYLICLSGTLAVFYQEWERWEQPEAHELQQADPASVQRAVASALGRLKTPPPHLYVGLPTTAMPRVTVSTEEAHQAWFVGPDGSLGEEVAHDWTHLLLNLHIYLHLPATLGLIVVGSLGAMLFGLIVSGFLAHPRIVKDAFRLRLGGSLHLEQVDLHNRLSVWGAPFHVIMALTGAYFGLATAMFFLLGGAFHKGDTEAAINAIFAAEPKLHGDDRVPNVERALREVGRVSAAGTAPSFMNVHDAGTPKQFIEIEVVQPGRLIWAEYYRFDGAGNYIGRTDYADGAVGRQVIYSSYRIHFGNFGGVPVKILYSLLGLSLTVISVTGVNIWLARRKTRDYINDLWIGTVWGAPAALALTTITEVLLNVPSTAVFWIALLVAIAWALRAKDPARARRDLCATTAALLFVFVAGYLLKFDTTRLPMVAWWMNGGLAATAIVMSAIAAGSSRTIVFARASDARASEHSEQVAHGDLDHTRAV